jgi:hypothetical protein
MLVLAGALVLAGTSRAAAPPRPSAVKGKPAEVFGLTKVWRMHLIIQPADWQKMHPSRGGFGRPAAAKSASPSPDRKARGGFGFDFEYVKGDLVIEGTRLNNVGVRFKGNSSYAQAQHGLKRPFRIAFDRHIEGQTFCGLRRISLNNHVMDPTTARENLSFAIYRAAGVPAPRTAYVELTLTVPGKHENQLLGLYTLIEAIDKRFLEERFGSGKGMLLKPERIGPLDYLGDNWSAWEPRYRPKTKASEKARRRLMDLAWLVQQSSDSRFYQEIAQQIDVDAFLRYLAASVVLSSLDSFMGLGHNYYLYLDPKTDRFVFMPWDLDHSFGGLSFLGTTASMVDLSIQNPQLGRNRLVERLLADQKCYALYRGYLQDLLKSSFTPEGIKDDLAAIKKVTDPLKDREKRAAGKRGESSWSVVGLLFTPSSDLANFARRRAASIDAQLAGKAKGTVLSFPFFSLGEPHWVALGRTILESADQDKNGRLSREEAEAGARALFRACDQGSKKVLDQKELSSALGLLQLPVVRLMTKRNLALTLGRVMVARAGKDGKVSEESLAAAVGRLFDSTKREGGLDERGLVDALFRLTPPQDGALVGRPDPKPKSKVEKKEEKRK